MPYATDIDAAKALKEKYEAIRAAINKVIIGQNEVVDKLIISILCNGHSLLVGVPGLAKTLLVKNSGGCSGSVVQTHTVYARPDAQRYHRRRDTGRTKAVPIFERARICQYHPGR